MKKRLLLVGCMAILIAVLGYGQAAAPRQQTPRVAAPISAAQRTLLDQYCVTCHNDKLKTASLSLENLDLSTVGKNAELWEKVIRKLRAGVMPPAGMKRPSEAEYAGLTQWLEGEIDRTAPVNPGTKLIHRLNRAEYSAAIRDLLDIEIDAETLLPQDDSARGFDNVAGSLTISPTLLEAYVGAAARIARMAVGYWKSPTEASYIIPADASQNQQIEGLPMGTRGGLLVQHTFPGDGEYMFAMQHFELGFYDPGAQIELTIDGQRVHLFDYAKGIATGGAARFTGSADFEVTLPVKAGTHTIGGSFLAQNYGPPIDMIRQYDRKSLENEPIPQLQYPPAIQMLRIQGPFNAVRTTDSPSIRKILTCRPSSAAQEAPCAREILSTLARRAYRRPSNTEDLESLMAFYEEGRRTGTFEDGIELALRRILASPDFLVRTEREPANLATGKTYRISDLELASRLSFFLWSSIPDEQLINLAGQRRLSNPVVLEQQVRRMLADPRSEALVKNFVTQWLFLRNLPGTSPDGLFFPDWDDELRQSFKHETELLFDSIIREDRNVLDMLTADYTFLNERLARQYGIPNIYGTQFRRVSLGPELDYRRGILGQGSFLSVTWSQNFRTSPVKRGVWILENILGTPPPEPPPNVPPLEATTGGPAKILTLREQMTLHRRNQPCAGCHGLMDPMGFALENFNADAKWRTKEGGEGGTPIDPVAQIYDGTTVTGPVGLRQALLRYSPQIVRMVTEKLMIYGLGRGTEYYDMPVIRSIVRDAEKNNYKFSSIVMGIVKSAPFQMRTKVEETGTN